MTIHDILSVAVILIVPLAVPGPRVCLLSRDERWRAAKREARVHLRLVHGDEHVPLVHREGRGGLSSVRCLILYRVRLGVGLREDVRGLVHVLGLSEDAGGEGHGSGEMFEPGCELRLTVPVGEREGWWVSRGSGWD